MDLMKLGTQLILSKLNENSNNPSESGIEAALGSLLGSGNATGSSNLDLGSLVTSMMGNEGFSSLVASWLGDGDNDPVSGSQIKDIFGNDKVSDFAQQLGIDDDSAADSLAEAVPQMVDKSSSGGSLLDAVGGISGAIDLARKLF